MDFCREGETEAETLKLGGARQSRSQDVEGGRYEVDWAWA